ncbi:MAG: helix-turn-helix transcriptional regulator [Syntrophobacteraceae bacterium]
MDLAEARFKSRITQWQLAMKVSVSQTKISLIERGYIAPSDEEKAQIAAALGLKTDQISWNRCSGGLR